MVSILQKFKTVSEVYAIVSVVQLFNPIYPKTVKFQKLRLLTIDSSLPTCENPNCFK